MEPGLELPGVAKLADIHFGHISFVAQDVAHRQEGGDSHQPFRKVTC
jgi:hypothetical protein